MAVDFDLFHPDVRRDPYPTYRALREAEPVHQSAIGYWFVSTYAAADAVLRDRRFGRDFRQFLDAQMGQGALRDLFEGFLFFMDPPDHTRLRTLLSGAFTRDTVRRLRGRIECITDELVTNVISQGKCDLIHDLAAPLPVQVICELLGLPVEVVPRAHEWSRDLAAALEFILTPEVVERGNRSALAASEYLRDLLRERRSRPQNGLIDRLIEVEINAQRLTEQEIISASIILFGAGHETTTALIGNSFLALLAHPDQLRLLRDDPNLTSQAVDELLRYDAPFQLTGRYAREDVAVAGVTIPAGSIVVVMLGSANRDPARFPDPDRLDLLRRDNTPLSFGGGIHYCLGAMLARAEVEIAINTLLRRLPTLRTASSEVQWRDTLVLRGPTKLPLVW